MIRVFETTFASTKTYADPFNEVDVDAVFAGGGRVWRVPAFWRGGERWTVRFAPPAPGVYPYRLECSDLTNSDLHGLTGDAPIERYSGPSELRRRGPIEVSADRRHFVHADGTPFYWLGDTWWTGLSSRLDDGGFATLVADRVAKGFTVVQIVAGLVPAEELAPIDPGFANDGGAVWDADFARINPAFFDEADRRIEQLLDASLLPALVGAWSPVVGQMGVEKCKQHWRYLIARYGAYPVVWIAAGEMVDPPESLLARLPPFYRSAVQPGLTELVRYIRDIDPYRRPLTAHEAQPPMDLPLQDEMLTDFDLFQSGHFGAWSLAAAVAQTNRHYARTSLTKPIVQGEIGYEGLGGIHLEDFQRWAFWLSMLNGAAGHTYGADGIFEFYSGDKPLHRQRWSFTHWREGMQLPGSRQLGLGGKLLRQYKWWAFKPRPDWVTPGGSTLLQPTDQINDFELGLWEGAAGNDFPGSGLDGDRAPGLNSFRLPYAAGIDREVRVVYIPSFKLVRPKPPTILGLEADVVYRGYFWQPVHGIRFDLGRIALAPPGRLLYAAENSEADCSAWSAPTTVLPGCQSMLAHVSAADVVVGLDIAGDAEISLVLRYRDEHNFLLACYAPAQGEIFIQDVKAGAAGPKLGVTRVHASGWSRVRIETRGNKAMMMAGFAGTTGATPIVDIETLGSGRVGLRQPGSPAWRMLEVRASAQLIRDNDLARDLVDSAGGYRGRLEGAAHPIRRDFLGWDEFARTKAILLDAYRPETIPASGDWVLILEAESVTREGLRS